MRSPSEKRASVSVCMEEGSCMASSSNRTRWREEIAPKRDIEGFRCSLEQGKKKVVFWEKIAIHQKVG